MENCERDNCMYQHEIDEDDEKSEEEEESEEEQESAKDDDTTDDDVKDDNVGDNTFCNPSQSDESENDEVKQRKCELCTFITGDKKTFKRHKFESHSVKGKYACMNCKRAFETRKLFNNHKYLGC